MARINLSFKNPEEKEEAFEALNAWRYKAIIQDLDNQLRSVIKYNSTLCDYPVSFADLDAQHKMASEIGLAHYIEVEVCHKIRQLLNDLRGDLEI